MEKFKVTFILEKERLINNEYKEFSTFVSAKFENEEQAYFYIEYMQEKIGSVRCGLWVYDKINKKYKYKGCIFSKEEFEQVVRYAESV